MRILIAHNYYQQAGGEDAVVAQEAALLKAAGHDVTECFRHNSSIASKGAFEKIKVAKNTLWSSDSKEQFARLIAEHRPDVAHFHNTFPLISPAAYYACQEAGIGVVQTLHNYRLLCPSALFYRDDKPCEDCLGKSFAWSGVRHACYRNSRLQSATVAAMLAFHRSLDTWRKKVDFYFAFTDFARERFIAGGLPPEKIIVKPNCVNPDPGIGEGEGGYALFVGRLSPEKGVDTLLAAWDKLGCKVKLKIVGEGSLSENVRRAAERNPYIEWVGQQPKEQVIELMKAAGFLVLPSTCYEGFPVVVAEAYATGLPVIGSNLGSLSSIIVNERTGVHFVAGDSDSLAAQIERIAAQPSQLTLMRRHARLEYEAKYTAAQNYKKLIEVYDATRHLEKESSDKLHPQSHANKVLNTEALGN